MMKALKVLAAIALAGCYATVGPDGRSTGEAVFSLRLPEVLPPMVVVQPGVTVAGDMDEEVFYADGYYYARQDRYWYRSHDHRGGWARVDGREVPAPIAQSSPGRYRHYRGEERRHDERRGDDDRREHHDDEHH